MYLLLSRENDATPDQAVFQEYINLERRYAAQAFENLARGVGGDRGELTRYFRGMILSYKNMLKWIMQAAASSLNEKCNFLQIFSIKS